MKILACLASALFLTGCAGTLAKSLRELKGDPAKVDFTFQGWGVSATVHRAFPTNWVPPAK